MSGKTGSTGKAVSMWMDNHIIDALDKESEIQKTSKSKIFCAAVMRYVGEMTIEREYKQAMKDLRERDYDSE